MATILFDGRWIAPHGIGRVAREYRDRLAADYELLEITEGGKPSHPLDWLFLARQFRRSKADLLITPGYNGTPLAGHRQIFIIHDLIHFQKEEPGGWAKRLYYNTIIRAAAARASLVTVSGDSAAHLRRIWPETARQLKVIPNGLSEPFLGNTHRLTKEARLGVILFGNNRWHKNLPHMLAALALWQVSRDGLSSPVTIIGDLQVIKPLIERAGVTQVRYLSRASDEELMEAFRQAQCLLLCSLYEGFGLPLIEALSCGCPVVASDIAVFREIASAGCVFVDPGDTEAIAVGIDQTSFMEVAPATSLAIADRFDWNNSYAMLKTVVEERLSLSKKPKIRFGH